MLQAPWSRNYPSCLPLPVPPSALSSSSSSPFFSSLFSFLAPHRIIILTGIQGDNESPSGRLETGSQRGRNWRSSIYIPFQHLPLCNSFPFFYFSLSLLLSLSFSLSFSFSSFNIAENRAKKEVCETQGLFHFANIYWTLELRTIVFSCNVSCWEGWRYIGVRSTYFWQ